MKFFNNLIALTSKGKLSFCFFVLILSFFPANIFAQLTVNNAQTATQLAQLLAGPNITITNASLTGSNLASGAFNGVNSNIGMNSGVILSTGDIANAPGPNNSAGGGDNLNNAGTAQMDSLAGGVNTFDAIILQFDFAIQSDFVQFQYIFASEEYPEYAPPNASVYNDVFAFFISGPGIVGEENIALVPSTNNPVTISNINAVTNNQYYIDNTGGTTVQYDAWTTILTAKRINLIPCQTYTMKLVIADAGDAVWNSAVFLLENSFIQGTVNAQTQTVNGDNIALEGCIPASFNFSLDAPSPTNTVITYQIWGTATNGVDYALIDTSITIPAGDTSASIIINSIADGIPEGQESIFIVYKPDICSPYDTAFLYIDDAQPIQFTLNETDLTCFQNSTGQILVNASGGFPPYTYEVNGPGGQINDTLNPITGLPAGTYTVQVFDIYGCKAEALVVGGVFDADTLFLPDGNGVTYTTQIPISGFGTGETIDSLSQINAICATMEHSYLGDLELKIIAPSGQSVILKQYPGGGSCDLGEPIATAPIDGSASSTLTDPGTGYQYCWNSNPTYVTMVGESNNFTRNYTDAQGHNYTDNYLPAGSYQSFDPLSNLLGASMDGNWTMEITDNLGLDNGYVFEWNISLIGGLPDTTVIINEPDSITINGFITQAQCGGSDGAINLTVSGNFGPFTFLWSNGATTEDISNLAAGTYTVFVTDTTGCSDSAVFNLNNISSLNITSTVTQVTCTGGSNGSINVTTSGGTLPYSFSWSNGATTEDITNVATGNYTLSITDSNGCQFSDIITVGTLPPIVITLNNSADEFCGQANGSIDVNISGGSGSYGYSWNNGASTEDLTNISNGTYTIIVTDANGCLDSANFSIINDVSNCSAYCYLTVSSIVVDESCGDGTGLIDVTVNQATQPYIVSWNTGQTIEDISNLNAGTYTITVTDANQCVEVTNITVGNNSGTLSISSNQISNENCGNADGAVNITVGGGTLPYSFLWSNGTTTEDITNLSAGNYTVTITDGNGCSTSNTYTIINNTGSLAASASIFNEICGNSAGGINLTVTGNAGSLSFLWSNGATTEDITGLSAGVYTCTITDANGCTLVTSPYNVINESSTLLLTSTTISNENCNNGQGSIDITIQGGVIPLTYTWSNGAATEDITGLSAGTYSCSITDGNGCSVSTGTLNLFNTPGTLNITTDFVTDEICGNNSGAIYVTTSGGTTPISYAWSNGSTSEDITGLVAGSYTLTATDSNGCVFNHSETVNNTSGTLQLTNAVVTDESCNNGVGSINIFVSGGSTPYSFAWSNGATTEDLTGLSAGNYNVTITDNNGCQVTNNYTVNNNTGSLSVTSQGTAENCSNGAGSIDITVTGGLSPYTFLWSNGATTEDLAGISGGTYSCTITDNSGCTILTGNITINNNPGSLVVTNTTTDENCGDASGSITLSASGGTLPYNYSWIPNVATTPIATGLTAGMYIYTVTDSNGCTLIDSAEIFNNSGTLSLDNIVITDELCGNNLGSIDITVSGGATPLTYLWNTAATTEDISNLSSGSYSCVISDANGCSINTGNINVSNNSGALSIANVVTTDEACGNGLGGINITITGGSTPYTFSWSNGATTEDITNVSAGNYTCDVTDVAGCVVQVQATIQNTSGSLYTTSNIITDETCGAANGSININPLGGSTPLSFLWSNGSTTEDITNLSAGTYTVTITDAGGCTYTESYTIINNGANLLISSVTINDEMCGNNAGGINITVQGGTSPFTYSWSNGSSLEDLTNITSGGYSVTITDFNNCSTNGSFTVNENTGSLAIDSFIVTDEICGNGIGAIDVTLNSPSSNPCCTFTLNMYDANNNGWGGNPTPNVVVYINGSPQGTYTVPVGQGNSIQTELIPVCTGDIVALEYLPGNFNNSNSYDLLDASGTLLFADGPNPSGPGISYTTTASCPVVTPSVTYLWSNGLTTEDISNLNAGTYTITVTDANGCSVDSSGTVQNITGGFSANLTATTDENCGDTTGTVDITVTGGVLPYTFVWSNGATTEDLTNLSAGTYNVIITDSVGCSVNISATVNNISGSLSITNAVVSDENCGDGSGFIDLTVNGTATPFSYSWSNGATTQDLAGLSAGSYTVTITDNSGCMLVQNYIINNNNGGLNTSTSMNDESCSNSDGNITVTANGGVSSYTFSWTGGTPTNCCVYTLDMTDVGNSWNGASIDVLVGGVSVGNYTVFFGGANTETFSVCDGQSIELIWNSGTFDNEVSFNLLDASGSVIFAQGPSPTLGSIFTGTGACPAGINNVSSLNNIPAGTYIVTTTDAVGCSITDTIIVTNTFTFSTSSVVTDDNCNLGNGAINITTTGGATPFTFNWSNGATTEDITNITANNYNVTITDASGCSIVDSFIVNNAITLTTSGTVVNDSCGLNNGSINLTLTGGTTPFTFAWSNGATSEDISNLSSGVYDVTVTDSTGCSVNDTFNVNSYSTFTSTSIVTNDTCSNGIGAVNITLTGGGTPFTFNWSNGATTEDISNLSTGTYTVTISDAAGCTDVDTFLINNISTFTSTGIVADDSCNYGGGAINLTLTGGATPFTFNWSNGATTEDILNLTAGTYTVIITDSSGCSDVDTFTVNNNSSFTASSIVSDDTCSAGTGAIDLTINSGGTPCCSYTLDMQDSFGDGWDGASIDVNINGSLFGNFTVPTGNSAIEIIPICDGDLLELIYNQGSFENEHSYTLIDANSNTVFTATAPPTSGSVYSAVAICPSSTPPITFSWSNGATTEDILNLNAGTYSVTITDTTGCFIVDTFIVNNITTFTTSGLTTNDSCGLGDGAINLTLNGGTTPFTFSWSNGATTEDVTNLTAGTYTVTSTDASGCSIVDTFVVSNTSTFAITSSISSDSCNLSIGAVNLTLTGGTTPFTFSWNNGATTEDISNLSAGTYSVTVTDAAGCSLVDLFTVSSTASFTTTVAITNDSCNLGVGNINLTLTGGTAPYSFVWSNGITTEDISSLNAGTYSVIITDASGCSLVDSFVVTNTSLSTSSGVVTDANCAACTDGAINVTATGDAPYNYNWSNGATTEDVLNLAPGNYWVIITGNSGCQDSLYFTVNYPIGVNEINPDWFINVYPNPARSEFILDYNFNIKSEVSFIITNVLGESIRNETITKTQGKITVNAKLMPPGVYFIKLISSDNQETIKLIIAR